MSSLIELVAMIGAVVGCSGRHGENGKVEERVFDFSICPAKKALKLGG